MIDWLDDYQRPTFPDTSRAMHEPNGLLAGGGIVSPLWLDTAYRQGIFPWSDPEEERMWWTPSPRAVITPASFRIPRTVRKDLNSTKAHITANIAFRRVMQACAEPRGFSDSKDVGTWISQDMIDAYESLHRAGRAISVEHWNANGELTGGFYGLMIGRVIFGESMFSREPNASKRAFATAAPKLFELGIELIDCQMKTEHLARFGLIELDRDDFEKQLTLNTTKPTIRALPVVLKS
ncbi:MAG: leucyl/phenylalanyl-tRNA--protein transferase [Oceanospirillales bacterium]|jgi:leucyl/phenylalanyl-tRNA--protein transferase|nr:MAG: leucyl/phenylalanyl-tRNA--protein transferase [Oceanospirillales bacterium]